MYYLYLKSDVITYSCDERSVYGELYLEIDNIKFPSDGWSDIISSVLDMWLDNALKLLQYDFRTTIEFNFMDGPYYFEGSYNGKDVLKINLFSRNTKINENPYEVSLYNFLSEIVKTMDDMLRCKITENNISIIKLRNKYKELKSIAKYNGYRF